MSDMSFIEECISDAKVSILALHEENRDSTMLHSIPDRLTAKALDDLLLLTTALADHIRNDSRTS